MSLSIEELEQRIADLNAAGMTLAAKALQKELSWRQKQTV